MYQININNPTNVQTTKTAQGFLGAVELVLDNPERPTIVVNGENERIFKLSNKEAGKVQSFTLIADPFTYPSTAKRYKMEPG